MKRNIAVYAALAYSLLLFLIAGGNFYLFFIDQAFSELLVGLLALALGGLMVTGSLLLKYKGKPGRELLIIAGVLTAPLGLIVAFLAYKAGEEIKQDFSKPGAKSL